MNGTENPASTNRLMEEVCERENLKAALRRGNANKGSPGDRSSPPSTHLSSDPASRSKMPSRLFCRYKTPHSRAKHKAKPRCFSHSIPRPPQTPTAPFKPTYRKCRRKISHLPLLLSRGTSDKC